MSAEFNPNNLPDDRLDAFVAQPSPATDADDLMWELLSLYADGEASPDEAAQVERMLRHDAEYARAYSFMRQTSSVVRAIVEVEPPAFLREAILAKTSHRLTFAQRLSAGFDALRAQLAPAHTGRWALAGGSLAACALLIGVLTARPANNTDNGAISTVVASVKTPSATNSSTRPLDVNAPPKTIAAPRENIANADNAPKTAAPAQPLKINMNGLRSEPPIMPLTVAAVDTTKTAPTFGQKTSNPVLPGKPNDKIASINPPRKLLPPFGNTGKTVSDNGGDTQSVSPMMDANVQHQQVAMITTETRPDDDLDKDVITGDSGNAPTPAVPTPDTDSPTRNRIVGKLQLSKLPPAARHLQTAADIQRIQEVRNMNFAATVMDGTQRREADVAVISSKF